MRLDEINLNTILPFASDFEDDRDVATIERVKLKRPKLYKVLLHNDDYTTMEFVIMILKMVFGKSGSNAEKIMYTVHNEGAGICGVYIHEIAETKVQKVTDMAKEHGHPLVCTFEEE